MTEYTKEQQDRAIEMVESHELGEAEQIVLSMAKRTVEAEAVARRCDGHIALAKRLDTKCDVLEKQRDALLRQRKRDQKTIMELTNQLDKARVEALGAKAAPVVVTREVWEAMHELAEVLGMFIPDTTVAAQAVRTRDAIRRMLEPKG